MAKQSERMKAFDGLDTILAAVTGVIVDLGEFT
jgi:hypothetical protein